MIWRKVGRDCRLCVGPALAGERHRAHGATDENAWNPPILRVLHAAGQMSRHATGIVEIARR